MDADIIKYFIIDECYRHLNKQEAAPHKTEIKAPKHHKGPKLL